MHPSSLEYVLWLLSFVGTAAVLWLACCRDRRAWPSLIALLSTDLLLSGTLYAVHSHYKIYFYLYWYGSVLQTLLRLWVMLDALRSIPGTGFIHTKARLVILFTSLGLAIGAGVMTWGDRIGWVLQLPNRTQSAKMVLEFVLMFDRAASFACLTLCISILAAVYLIGLGWDLTGARIACGLGLQLAELALRRILCADPHHSVRLAATYLGQFTHLVVLAIWFYAFFLPPTFTTPPTSKAETQ